MENERLIQDAISHAIPSNEELKLIRNQNLASNHILFFHFQIHFEIWNKVRHKHMFETHL
jgi:hypothetical protein